MKHLPGFVPVQFRLVGKILLSVGVILLVFQGVDYLAEWNIFTRGVLYASIGFVVVGVYIRIVSPKEKE